MIKTSSSKIIAAVSLALAASFLPHAQAVTRTWLGASGADWSVATNWSGSTKPTGGDTALFNTTGLSVANAVADQAVLNINFATGAGSFTIGTTGGFKLKLANGGTITLLNTITATGVTETINSPISIGVGSLATNYAFDNSYTDNTSKLIIAGSVTGNTNAAVTTLLNLTGANTGGNAVSGVIADGSAALNINKSQAGTWNLGNAGNSFTGGVQISQGILSVATIGNSGANSALGTNGTIQMGAAANTGTLLYTGAGEISNKVINLVSATTGGATIDQSGSGVLKFTSDMTNAGMIKTVTLQGSTGGTGEFAGKIIDGTGATSLTKAGTGTWTLSGANTYTGTTTVGGGTLKVSGSGTLGAAAGTANLAVNTGGTLDLNGLSENVDNFTGTGGTVYNSGSGTSTLQIGSNNGTGGNFAGVIANNGGVGGVVALTKVGTGGITLSGANTYTGGTTLTAGVLNLGNASALGTGALTITGGSLNSSVANLVNSQNNAQNWNGNFAFVGTNNLDLGTGAVTMSAARTVTVSASTLTVGGVIGDGGSGFGLTKAGVGALTLTGANTYSGGTTLSTGTLNLGNASALGTGAFTISGGSLDSAVANLVLSTNNTQNWNGNFAFTGTNSLNLGTGAVTINATRTITTTTGGSGVLTVGGVIGESGGSFGLIKAQGGTLTLGGVNTFTGNLTIQNGTLNVSTVANSTVASNLGAGSTILFGNLTTTGILNYTGSGGSTNRTLQIVSSATTGGATINNNGTNGGTGLKLTGSLTSASTSAGTITLGGMNTDANTVSGVISNGTSSAISLVKADAGTWMLTGANTYTGSTTISGGTLNVNSAGSITARLANTASVSVSTGGTLLLSNSTGTASTDRINNAATVSLGGGTLASANSANEGVAATKSSGSVTGTSTVGLGALTLTAGSTLDFDSASNGNLMVFSGFTPAGFTLAVNNWTNSHFNGSTNSGLSTDDRLVFNADQTTNFSNFNFNGLGAGVNVSQIQLDSGFYEVGVFTAVPEPSTWVGAGLLSGLAVYSVRRRKTQAAL